MNFIARRADLVHDIVNLIEQYKSWNLLEIDTWNAIHEDTENVILAHEGMGMLVSGQAMVGLEQPGVPKVWIEIDVLWHVERDPDSFVLFVTPHGTEDPKGDIDAYDRAMSVV